MSATSEPVRTHLENSMPSLTAAEAAAWPNEAWPHDDTDWTEVFGQ